jgi:hypothetical protein
MFVNVSMTDGNGTVRRAMGKAALVSWIVVWTGKAARHTAIGRTMTERVIV